MITVALIRWVGRIPKKTHFCDMRTCEMGNTEQGTGAQTVRLSRGNIRIALRIDRQQWGCPVSRITAYAQATAAYGVARHWQWWWQWQWQLKRVAFSGH